MMAVEASRSDNTLQGRALLVGAPLEGLEGVEQSVECLAKLLREAWV